MYENRYISVIQRYTPLWIMIVSFLFWMSLFYVLQQPLGGSSKTDSLSGTSYNSDEIKADQSLNPNAPYFTGFERLNAYGLTSDAQRYTKDFITNYVLYNLQKSQARISLASNSFSQSIKATNISYTFKFGVNGGDIHTASVETSMINNSFKVTILNKDGSVAAEKAFTPTGTI